MERLFNKRNLINMKFKVLFIFLLTLSFTSCSQANTSNEIGKKEVSDTILKRVSKTEFNLFIKSNPEVTLVDVRTESEYKKGTIKNAVNINVLDANFESEINKLDKTEPVLIFCKSGGRSSKALKKMKDLGFTHVLELIGGYSNY